MTISADAINTVFREYTTEDLDYHKDIALDKNSLDVEAMRHSSIVLKWNTILAQATSRRDKVKEKLQLVMARLNGEARETLAASGAKSTEAMIDAWVKQHEDYILYSKKYRESEEAVNYLFGVKASLDHKKAMIEMVGKLWMCGYFARPQVPTDIDDLNKDERRKETAQHLKESITKRKIREQE